MRIGIDTFSLDRPGGNYGVGRSVYAWNLLPHLFKIGTGHRFVIFANRDNQSLIPRAENVTVVVSWLPNRIRPLRVLHEQLLLPFQFKKHRLDLIHFLGNDICLWLGRRALLTVYDLMWKYYLENRNCNLKYRFLFIFGTHFASPCRSHHHHLALYRQANRADLPFYDRKDVPGATGSSTGKPHGFFELKICLKKSIPIHLSTASPRPCPTRICACSLLPTRC